MTQRQVQAAIKRISRYEQAGCSTEALLAVYHLHLAILRDLHAALVTQTAHPIKSRQMLRDIARQRRSSAAAKTLISGSHIKSLKPWLKKMDQYIKTLRVKKPSNSRVLQSEGKKLLQLMYIVHSKGPGRK